MSSEESTKNPNYLDDVRAFMTKHGQFMSSHPTSIIPKDVVDLRCRLIAEEGEELFEAMYRNDILGVADGLADLLYVVFGCALAYGIPIGEVFDEVHRSNMTKKLKGQKAGEKLEKDETYSPAELHPILFPVAG